MSGKAEVVFRTQDHPEANGRAPSPGDRAYEVRFPLDDGRELVVNTGQDCFDKFSQMILDSYADTPPYNDGSTNMA